jgi:hypothetical protein
MMVYPQIINICFTFQEKVFLISGTHLSGLGKAYRNKGFEVTVLPWDASHCPFQIQNLMDISDQSKFILDILDDDVYGLPYAGVLPNTTKAQQKEVFKNHLPVFKLLSEAQKKVLVMTPLPRIAQPIGMEEMESWKTTFKTLAYCRGRKKRLMVRFANPSPILKDLHWGEDPIHPLGAGYDQIVDFLEQAGINI